MADLSKHSNTVLLWTDPGSLQKLSLQFDAVTTETKDDSVTVTDHAVEDGSNVADNARDEPAILTIEALISGIQHGSTDLDHAVSVQETITVNGRSTPGTKQVALDIPRVPIALSESGLIQAGVGALVGLFSGGPKATLSDATLLAQYSTQAAFLVQDSPRNRGRDVYEKLLLLKSQHVQLDLIKTTFRDYTNMMITRLSQPRAVGDGSTAKFQIDFKEIRIATSQSVIAPKPAPSAVRANVPVAKGAQNPKPADQQEKQKSLAAHAADALGALGGH